jgi:hypothetical protein
MRSLGDTWRCDERTGERTRKAFACFHRLTYLDTLFARARARANLGASITRAIASAVYVTNDAPARVRVARTLAGI